MNYLRNFFYNLAPNEYILKPTYEDTREYYEKKDDILKKDFDKLKISDYTLNKINKYLINQTPENLNDLKLSTDNLTFNKDENILRISDNEGKYMIINIEMIIKNKEFAGFKRLLKVILLMVAIGVSIKIVIALILEIGQYIENEKLKKQYQTLINQLQNN